VVWESPVLRYYAVHSGQGVKLVSRQFYSRPVAIPFQLNSPLRRQVDVALLALQENGTYQRLNKKWFGDF
jgi:ABC-type amino acid transport substrate-binding protein